jgi:MinD-like ATPase involved in chromosome partitioning or flagellar assembly
MQLENGDVVVERLRVVIVVNVSSGHAKSLSSRAAKLLGQIVVTNPDVNSISGAYNTIENYYF